MDDALQSLGDMEARNDARENRRDHEATPIMYPNTKTEDVVITLGVLGDLATALGVKVGPSIPEIPFSSTFEVGKRAFETKAEQSQIEMPFGSLDTGGQIDRGNWIDTFR